MLDNLPAIIAALQTELTAGRENIALLDVTLQGLETMTGAVLDKVRAMNRQLDEQTR